MSHVGGRAGETFHADRDQEAALQREAEHRGLQLHLLPPELDVSGGLPLEQRPSLLHAVQGVQAGEYDGIIVAYLSRLGRNVREQLRVWDLVEAAGGRIIVVQENLDTSTPAGRFQRTVMLGVAEMELDLHRERFDQLREWATQAGVWQRRQTPTGYRRDPNTRGLVPNDDAGRVREAFAMRAAGHPVVKIADMLGMTPSGARQLLRNRVYLGELKVGRHVNPHAHEPIVTEQAFLAAQSAAAPRQPRDGRPVALLAGLVRCASCGHVMSRSRTGGREQYGCHGRHSAGRCPKPASIRTRTLDEHVTGLALAEFDRLTVTADGDRDVERALQQVQTAEAELAAFLEGVTAAGIQAADFADAAATRRADLEGARANLSRLSARQLPAATVDVREAWNRFDEHQRNRLLRSLIETVVVRPVGRGQRVPVGDRAVVLRFGAGLVQPHPGGGAVIPLIELTVDGDHPAALRPHLTE